MRKRLNLDEVSAWAFLFAFLGWFADSIAADFFGPRLNMTPFIFGCGICSLVLVLIAALTIVRRGHATQQPVEIAALQRLRQAAFLAWSPLIATAEELGPSSPVLAFIIPGATAVWVLLLVIYLLPWATERGIVWWRTCGRLMMWVLVILLASLAIYGTNHRLVTLAGTDALVAIMVAVAEAIVVTPLVYVAVRAIGRWVVAEPKAVPHAVCDQSGQKGSNTN